VQLSPPGAASFSVLAITDPNGTPTEVLDVDLGFVITGTVTLPNFLNGTATVCVYADELGGPFDNSIAPCAQLTIQPARPIPDPSGSTTYPWTVTYVGSSGVLPDPSTTSQLYRLAAVFVFGDPALDIGSFVELGLFLIN
jgi:hypothetical protein